MNARFTARAHRRRQLLLPRRTPQLQRRAGSVAQFVQINYFVAFAPHKQGFRGRLARHRRSLYAGGGPFARGSEPSRLLGCALRETGQNLPGVIKSG